MSRRTIIIISIFLAFFLFNISLILQNKKENLPNEEQQPHELASFFNKEEIKFILNNNINSNDIKPYLNFTTFDIYNFHIYEQIRTINNFSYLETINHFNYPHYYNYDAQIYQAVLEEQNLILVNKNFYLLENYQPNNLINVDSFNVKYIKRENENLLLNNEALTQYNILSNDALKSGFEFYIFSGYRDYQKQKILYYFINNENNHVSAKPGHSEHQTGLAIDLSTLEWGLSNYLENTNEYKWLAKNAHKYGFILRYPKEKENITGYSFEPWHFRYVGKNHAKIIYELNLSLEEYLYKSFELK